MPHNLFGSNPTNGWSELVQTRVTRETKEKLSSLADKENRSISSIIREAIEVYFFICALCYTNLGEE